MATGTYHIVRPWSGSTHFAESGPGYRLLLNPGQIRIQTKIFVNKKKFWIKNRNIGLLKLLQRTYSKGSGRSPSSRENSSNRKFLHFVLFLGTVLACWDPDLLTHLNSDPVRIRTRNCSQAIVRISENKCCGSGSTCFWASWIRIRIHYQKYGSGSFYH
jgi:hypothetical protein